MHRDFLSSMSYFKLINVMNDQQQLKIAFAKAIDDESQKAVFSETFQLITEEQRKNVAFGVLVRINEQEYYSRIMNNLICSLDDAKEMAYKAVTYYWQVFKFCNKII